MSFAENTPYIFISYAHKNDIHLIINALETNEYNVWYDTEIQHATEYNDVIATHVSGCYTFVAYITEEYLE
ncbi:MAG: toll/interleukin-1 receptor domain-containing protein, partial [Clostridia bacterium]|nr:toll/interleukin-1 receptor domain-containing protein [Clostridia bacterium]